MKESNSIIPNQLTDQDNEKNKKANMAKIEKEEKEINISEKSYKSRYFSLRCCKSANKRKEFELNYLIKEHNLV